MNSLKKKKLSPFSKEFWIQKGYTEEDAEYKRNSIRPIRKEYWMERGYSEEDAILKALDTKAQNNKNGSKKSNSRSLSEKRRSSPRCHEYWMERGYSEEDAKAKVKESQSLGSLENFIKRYGIIEGTNKWKDRQVRWIETLSKKTDEEKVCINLRKNSIKLENFDSIDECIDILKRTRNITLFKNAHDFRQNIVTTIKEKPYLRYYPIDYFLKKQVSKIQFSIFEYLKIDIREIINDLFVDKTSFIVNGKIRGVRQWTDEGLLRSSFEIYFFENFKKIFPDKHILIDKRYPESSFRYDFLIDNTYIEICPMIHHDETYAEKMKKKQKIFGCVLLSSIEEIDQFLYKMTLK